MLREFLKNRRKAKLFERQNLERDNSTHNRRGSALEVDVRTHSAEVFHREGQVHLKSLFELLDLFLRHDPIDQPPCNLLIADGPVATRQGLENAVLAHRRRSTDFDTHVGSSLMKTNFD